jgi:hypothetical protein
MFLTETELQQLTGYRRGADQRRWLAERGFMENVDYYVDRNGRPVLPSATFGQTQTNQPTSTAAAALTR